MSDPPRKPELISEPAGDLGKQLDPGRYFIVISSTQGCDECGGPEVALFEATPAGFSCGGGFKHTSECPSLSRNAEKAAL